jgi:hypothetical protein
MQIKKYWFPECCLQSDELQFVNILSPNKVVISCSANLQYYVC